MSLAVSSFMSNYTYSYSSRLRPKLDKDDDGNWSKAELQNYTKSYEKATGSKLDAEKIMTAYDADKNGVLNAKEQSAAYEKDALGLSALSKKTSSTEVTAEGKDISEKLAELMESMSSGSKVALSNVVRRSEQAAQLLSVFSSNTNSLFSSFADLTNQQNAAKMYAIQMRSGTNNNWNAVSGQLMNMMI